MGILGRGAAAGATGLGKVGGPALLALLALPVVTGAGIGMAKEKLTQPSEEDVDNLGRELVLAELAKQRAQTRRLAAIRKLQKQDEEEGTGTTQWAEREIRV